MIKAVIILMLTGLPFIRTAGQSSAKLSLNVDGTEIDTIQRGEVLLFEIVLTNPSARSAASWNSAAGKQLKELDEQLKQKKISPEDFEKEKKSIQSQLKKPPAVSIGSDKDPWVQMIKWNIRKTGDRSAINWPIKYLGNPATENIAVLDERAYYLASYGIDPSGISQLAAGSYEVTAMIGEIRSTAVTVRIDATTLPVQLQNNTSHLLKLGNFYWQSGDATKAIAYADKILTGDPAYIGALLLKADALRLQKSWSFALEIYNKALNEYYNKAGKNAEPPEYIIDMIEIVKGKIN